MDQCRCRPSLSERCGSHWSTIISGEIRMDQSLGALFSGEICMESILWTNGRESSSKLSPQIGIGPWMVLPSKGTCGLEARTMRPSMLMLSMQKRSEIHHRFDGARWGGGCNRCLGPRDGTDPTHLQPSSPLQHATWVWRKFGDF